MGPDSLLLSAETHTFRIKNKPHSKACWVYTGGSAPLNSSKTLLWILYFRSLLITPFTTKAWRQDLGKELFTEGFGNSCRVVSSLVSKQGTRSVPDQQGFVWEAALEGWRAHGCSKAGSYQSQIFSKGFKSWSCLSIHVTPISSKAKSRSLGEKIKTRANVAMLLPNTPAASNCCC